MDDSTLVTRKDAANRDKQYDLRTLVNHQISERICTPDLGLEYTWLGINSICHMRHRLGMCLMTSRAIHENVLAVYVP